MLLLLAGLFSDPVDVNNLYSINQVLGNTTPATDAYTNVETLPNKFYRLSPL